MPYTSEMRSGSMASSVEEGIWSVLHSSSPLFFSLGSDEGEQRLEGKVAGMFT